MGTRPLVRLGSERESIAEVAALTMLALTLSPAFGVGSTDCEIGMLIGIIGTPVDSEGLIGGPRMLPVLLPEGSRKLSGSKTDDVGNRPDAEIIAVADRSLSLLPFPNKAVESWEGAFPILDNRLPTPPDVSSGSLPVRLGVIAKLEPPVLLSPFPSKAVES